MKKTLIIIAFGLTSCNGLTNIDSVENIYYPDSTYFDSSTKFKLDLKNRIKFNKIEELANILFQKNLSPYFELKRGSKISKVIIFRNDHSMIQHRNKLIVRMDSVYGDKPYPIKDFDIILQRYADNNGKDYALPENFDKIFIQIELDSTSNSENLEELLIGILDGFDKVNNQGSNKLNLKIGLKYDDLIRIN
ncbi:hypothetical protein [Cellulophaga baltica]|uniref:Lipoprotein n=1 Tax=Cellulophaga baltica 18 TaxID=1348584 RepID=A0AAU8RZ06_9FLAO|nr:hypothetical protein [Cellulophaga baltica]AIZ42375.1 hypothetical protein M666_12765 [Cellulophaga baltica 18]